MAAYHIAPCKAVTGLTEDGHEQVSLLFQNSAEKMKFLAVVTIQEFNTTVEKLIIKILCYINLP